jgi:hypothetical protein
MTKREITKVIVRVFEDKLSLIDRMAMSSSQPEDWRNCPTNNAFAETAP